jgi:hypothetical protein
VQVQPPLLLLDLQLSGQLLLCRTTRSNCFALCGVLLACIRSCTPALKFIGIGETGGGGARLAAVSVCCGVVLQVLHRSIINSCRGHARSPLVSLFFRTYHAAFGVSSSGPRAVRICSATVSRSNLYPVNNSFPMWETRAD